MRSVMRHLENTQADGKIDVVESSFTVALDVANKQEPHFSIGKQEGSGVRSCN